MVSPHAAQARATRDAFYRVRRTEPEIAWEELSADEREGWSLIARTATEASPELAGARAKLAEEKFLRLHLAGERDVALITLRQLFDFAWTLSSKLGHREQLSRIMNRAAPAMHAEDSPVAGTDTG